MVHNNITDAAKDFSGNNRVFAARNTPTIEDGPAISWGADIEGLKGGPTYNLTNFRPNANTTAQWSLLKTPTLASSNLIARYLLNEASSGNSVTQINSTVNSYHLNEIDYNGTAMFWTQNSAGNKGIRSTSISQQQHARRKVTTGDTLISASVGNKWTWEIVIDGDMLGSANNDRVVAVHRRTSTGISAFSIVVNTTEFFCTGFNNSSSITDGTFLHSMLRSDLVAGRNIIHLVIDSTLATAADRAKFYLNGVFKSPSTTTNTVIQNSTLAIDTDYDLILFNRGDGVNLTRSPQGNLYYAALYNKVLTQDEINVNYSALITSDDTEGSNATLNYEGVRDINEDVFIDSVGAYAPGKIDEYKFDIEAGTTLQASSNLLINYVANFTGNAQTYVNVYQGTNLIKSSITDSTQPSGTIILSVAETANITDLPNLSLRITSF
jgi:hypothetical protein